MASRAWWQEHGVDGCMEETIRKHGEDRKWIKPQGPPLSDLFSPVRSHLLKVPQCPQIAQPSVQFSTPVQTLTNKMQEVQVWVRWWVRAELRSLPLAPVASETAVRKDAEMCRMLRGRLAPPGFLSFSMWTQNYTYEGPYLCLVINMFCYTIFFQKP